MPWNRCHPNEIPRREWLECLRSSEIPSPCLLPEWPLYWESIWPGSRAEIWRPESEPRSLAAVVLVRRLRWGGNWVFAQPYGTPGLVFRHSEGETCDEAPVADLVSAVTDRRTLQMTITPARNTGIPAGWRGVVMESQSWLLDLTAGGVDGILTRLSDSHRRNIEKGAHLQPEIRSITSAHDAESMIASWPPGRRRSTRIVLERTRAPAFAQAFSGTDAMRWTMACLDGRPVATILWLVLDTRAVYVDGTFDRRSETTGINHFLFARMLTGLHSEGVRHFDFGAGPLGTTSDGLARFKEGWGASAVVRKELILRRPLYHSVRRFW